MDGVVRRAGRFIVFDDDVTSIAFGWIALVPISLLGRLVPSGFLLPGRYGGVIFSIYWLLVAVLWCVQRCGAAGCVVGSVLFLLVMVVVYRNYVVLCRWPGACRLASAQVAK